ncbi:hypothetical protein FH972_018830 [Carpinus fangiana]|uniref:Uncharacterized protein n=1 Tax=Carpinus fangiana TaxID=176857 RepID=A0A5N6RRC6_9ROSI|nr:hypothetical protein FH972_018830 [Carpinus fangiana]
MGNQMEQGGPLLGQFTWGPKTIAIGSDQPTRSKGHIKQLQKPGDNILAVILMDPYDQLDLAQKVTSMAIASRVSKLELDVAHMCHKLYEKDWLDHAY